MPIIETVITEKYTKQPDGSVIVTFIEDQVEVPTQEELIAEKESRLLEIYEEIQSLKNK